MAALQRTFSGVTALVLALTVVGTATTAVGSETPKRFKTGDFRPSPYRDTVLSSRLGHHGSVSLISTSDGLTTRLSMPDGESTGWSPDRYGDTIVYEGSRDGTDVILIADLAKGTVSTVPDARGDGEPAVWGDTVVFTRTTDRGQHVFRYDVSTGDMHDLTPSAHSASAPDIYRETVVFDDREDIWILDLGRTDAPRRLIDAPGAQLTPAVWGDKVVYADWSVGLSDLRIYSLADGTDRVLVEEPGVQMSPAIWGNTLAYEDYDTFPPVAHTRVRSLEGSEKVGLASRIEAWVSGVIASFKG